VKAFHSFSGGTCIAIATVNIVIDSIGKDKARRGGEEEGEMIKSRGSIMGSEDRDSGGRGIGV